MSQATIKTSTGIKFDILEPTIDMVCIEDIAHASSQMNRFTGHCRFPYPVSQHSRLGSYLVPEEHALWFLLHDASEAYIGDMNRPLKYFSLAGQEYKKVEAIIQGVICDKFGLDRAEPAIVKEIDAQMLYAEMEQLMPSPETYYQWTEDKTKKAADVTIVETSFHENKRLFLNRFFQISNQ